MDNENNAPVEGLVKTEAFLASYEKRLSASLALELNRLAISHPWLSEDERLEFVTNNILPLFTRSKEDI